MPKLKIETMKRRALKLSKTYIENGLNQTATAKILGVTSQAVNQQLRSPMVQQTLSDVMDRLGMTDLYLGRKLKEGLEAKKFTDCLGSHKSSEKQIKVPDLNCRHKYLVTALEAKRIIESKIETAQCAINVFYGYRESVSGIHKDRQRINSLNNP